MVGERINEYLSTTNSLPKRILFYRDGVSTSQYAAVRDQEMRQIQAACKAKGCANALITIVVAVKRHATRFYPATPSFRHRNGNCLPGTLVDRLVTSPHYADFYLQSHHGLKGTAIPTHYFVIANKIGYKDTELQQLTYKLCYTYARATIGVSYAPPAYYADRLCDRGRAYLRDWFSPDRNSTHYQAYLTTKARIEQQQIGRLQTYLAGVPQNPVLPGRNAAKKTTQQIGIERAHKRHIEGLIAVDILAQARAAWQAPRAHGPGPWAGALDKTMFWM
jgi:eukaryotic translation initiation factor 2C